MSDWWIRKVEPAAVAAEASVSSTDRSSSPSAAAATAVPATATIDVAASNADSATIEAVEPSVSLSVHPLAAPLSPTIGDEDDAIRVAQAHDSDGRDKGQQKQQPTDSEPDEPEKEVEQANEPVEPEEDEEEDTAVEDESEHDILTLDDVIAPSTSSLSHSTAAATAVPGKRSHLPFTASLLADLDIAQLSPRKDISSNRLSSTPQKVYHSNGAAVGATVGSALDEFIHQQTQHSPLDASQQPTKHSNTTTTTATPQRQQLEDNDSNPFIIRRSAGNQRSSGGIHHSPAARRSFGQSLGLSIQAAIQGLHTHDTQQQSRVERKDSGEHDEENDEDEEVTDDEYSPPSAAAEPHSATAAGESDDDEDGSPASVSFDGDGRRKSDAFRSSIMRMRRVSRRESRSIKDKEESKEQSSAVQQPHTLHSTQAEQKEEVEGEERIQSASEQPASAVSEPEDGTTRVTAAVSLLGAGGTHEGLPTFHFNESHSEAEEAGREQVRDKRSDEEAPSNSHFATTAVANAVSTDNTDKRSSQQTAEQREGERHSMSGVLVDEQQPGAQLTHTQQTVTKQKEEEEKERRRTEERRKEEAEREAKRRQDEEEATRQRQRERERQALETQRRQRDEEERAKAVEREAADERKNKAAAIDTQPAAAPLTKAATASTKAAISSPSIAPSESISIGVWKSSRRSGMQVLTTQLTNAAFLQPIHTTPYTHLPVRVAHILLQAIIHWELLPSATSSSTAATASFSAVSATSFRSAFTSSTLSVNQTSFRFLPSSARAKSIDTTMAVFPHPLPAFSSLSAAPHFTVPPAATQDDSPQHNSEPTAHLTPLDRSVVLAALLHALHTSVHTAAREDDTPHICALFTVVAQLRALLLEHSNSGTASTSHSTLSPAANIASTSSASLSAHSPVLDRVYALPFMSNSSLVPSAPPPFDPFLPPPFTSISVSQWLNVQLLDLQALCHQLIVQAVMSAWQTSLPPLSDVWLEEDGGGANSAVLSSYCSSYQQFDGMCQLADWSDVQRQSVLSCCLHWLVCELFNSAMSLHNLTLDTGLRVKQFCSALSDFARRLVGDGFGSSVAVLITPLQELAMFLLMDKANTTLDEMRMLTPSMPLIALHHLLFVFMQSEDNEEDCVSPQLLQQVATQLAAEQHSGKADKQQSATKPTHIVLMLDVANQQSTALSDIAAEGVQWRWPDAVLLTRELTFVTQTQQTGESAIQ